MERKRYPNDNSALFGKRLYRTRLFDRMDQILEDEGVVLVEGEPGQGKTVLVETYLDSSNKRCVWIHLNQRHKNPMLLSDFIVRTIHSALGKEDGGKQENGGVLEQIQQLLLEMGEKTVLVFENLDEISESGASVALVQNLVEGKEDATRIIITFRKGSWNCFQNEGKYSRAMITDEELAFTYNEVTSLLKTVYELNLDEEDMEQIYGLSGHRIGTIVFLVKSLYFIPSTGKNPYSFPALAQRQSGGIEIHNRHYHFEKDIFADLQPEIKTGLVKSSVLAAVEFHWLHYFLRKADGDFNEAVLGCLDQNSLIETYYDAEKRKWFLKYQEQFRCFLQMKFELMYLPEEQRKIYGQIGKLCLDSGYYEEAARYYLKAREYQSCAEIIELAGFDIYEKGSMSVLKELLQGFPEEIIRTKPWIMFLSSIIDRHVSFHPRQLKDLYEVFAGSKNDPRREMLAMAFLLLISINHGQSPEYLPGLLARVEVAVEEGGGVLLEKVKLMDALGQWHLLRGEKLQYSVALFERAYWEASKMNAVGLQVSALSYAAMGSALTGQYKTALHYCDIIDGIIAENADIYIEFRPLVYTTRSLFFLLEGSLGKAEKYINDAIELSEKTDLYFTYLIGLEYKLMLLKYKKNYEEGDSVCKHLLNLADSQGSMKGTACFYCGLLKYAAGKYEEASALIQKAYAIVSKEIKSHLYMHETNIVAALLSTHCDQGGFAKKRIEDAIEYFNRHESLYFLVEAYLAVGLLNIRDGNREEARRWIERGMMLAQKKEITHFILINEEDLLKILLETIELQIKSVLDYAVDLIARSYGKRAEAGLDLLSVSVENEVKQCALQAKQKVILCSTEKVAISTMGPFIIDKGGKQINENEWKHARAKTLLKLIIARGTRNVTKEVLMEDLWPENTLEVQQNNFKVTLHRLRKILEPEMDKSYGSVYIKMHDDRISLNCDACTVDIDQFYKYYHKALDCEKGNNTMKAIYYYEQACAIYTDDFMEEELYLEPINRRREELKRKVLAALSKLSLFYRRLGDYDNAVRYLERYLEINPYEENVYCRIADLHLSKGAKSKALRVLKTAEKVLREAFDTELEPATRALYQKILTTNHVR